MMVQSLETARLPLLVRELSAPSVTFPVSVVLPARETFLPSATSTVETNVVLPEKLALSPLMVTASWKVVFPSNATLSAIVTAPW